MLDWAAFFSGIYFLFVHCDVVGFTVTYIFSCLHSIRTYSIYWNASLGVVKSSDGVELWRFITVMSHHIENKP